MTYRILALCFVLLAALSAGCGRAGAGSPSPDIPTVQPGGQTSVIASPTPAATVSAPPANPQKVLHGEAKIGPATEDAPPSGDSSPKPTANAPAAPSASKADYTAIGMTEGCQNPHPDKVLLTFDDGGFEALPILAILDRYGVKARWFPTGKWADGHGPIIAQLKADGQMLGDHSYSHPQMTAALGESGLRSEVEKGYSDTKVFRFPYGLSDQTSRRVVTDMGYSICGWTIDTEDWRGKPPKSAAAITQTVVTEAKPGSVVLMHQSFPEDVKALPDILDNLKKRNLI